MGQKLFKIFLIIIIYLPLACSTFVSAQTQTGSLKGKITDLENFALPGAFIYLSSPSILGIRTYVTAKTGRFKFYDLPPGRYKIIVEMPGFKTIKIEDVIIQAGMTIYIPITMEMSTIEEEITARLPSPMIDRESVKTASIREENLLAYIPFSRNLHDIVSSVAGIISEGTFYRQTSTSHGSTITSNIYALDGIKVNDPIQMYLQANINFDIMAEIEVETAALPAEIGNNGSTYINTVTKSGGNKFSGKALLYYSNDKLTNTLWPKKGLNARESSLPTMDKSLWDISLSLGGPLLEDRLWFFHNSRLIFQSRTTAFIPWTDPQGIRHEEFDWINKEKMGFFKLTSRVTPKFKIAGMFYYSDRYQPTYAPNLSWNVSSEATRIWNHGKIYIGNGHLNYVINQETFVDLKAGYFHNKLPLLLNGQVIMSPKYYDEGTGYHWGSAEFNEIQLKNRYEATVSLTRFQDDFLSGHHELKVGGEYEYIYGEQTAWKEDNLTLNYYYRSPYYFGFHESPTTGKLVGKGKINFYTLSRNEGELGQKDELRRLGFFIQDSITFAENLTFNLGIRFDRSTSFQPSFIKNESGNPVSLKIGQELIEPIIGLNPFADNEIPKWKNLMTWNSWSPRLGLIFDIFGKGKTLLKASFSRYSEYLKLQYLSPLNPFYSGRFHRFFWYDENMNGNVDINDTYELFPEDYRFYEPDYNKKRVDSDISSPFTNEFTIGLQQEISLDFTFRINYIYKVNRNIFENVRYAPDIDQDFYLISQDQEKWWIPFSTIVPGVDDYLDIPVTVYFLSKNAPYFFYRVKNVPQLKRNYQALEITFKKRMSNNWQLNGSLVFSKATGNIGLNYEASSGYTNAADSPNYFINLPENSRLDIDRPLVIKLMGTYRFPYNFFFSLYYYHMSGIPWARRVAIVPSESWTQQKNAFRSLVNVFLETPGIRRKKAYDNLDIRIEKELILSRFGKLSAFVDIINALGNKYRSINQNDGGYWFPDDENTAQGIRVLNPYYKKITSLSGVRIFRLSFIVSF